VDKTQVGKIFHLAPDMEFLRRLHTKIPLHILEGKIKHQQEVIKVKIFIPVPAIKKLKTRPITARRPKRCIR
jgi:hypothetical protein